MLTVHRAPSGSALVAALGGLLATPLADPFAQEVVAVPARGIERWLAQRLSHHLGAGPGRDGVCAQVAFPSPDALLDALVSGASPSHADAVAAWQPERAVWHLLDVLDGCQPDESWCAELMHHVGAGDSTRRYAVARRLTRLFDAYGRARPALLRSWTARDDATAGDLAWQPELWRRLRGRLGTHPAELLEDACQHLAVTAGTRLSLYGVTRIDASRLQVLGAVAQARDVHLFVHHPSRALWDTLSAVPPVTRRAQAPRPVRHPLLASLSRDVRELQLRLQSVPGLVVEHHDAQPAEPVTLLRRLQAGLAADEVLTAPLDPTDRSVQVHACHGRARQVEVLREVVLGLLADVPGLEPRDVLVLCPDVETYAPLVAAAFGDDAHPAAALRVSLADRSPRQTNPLLAVAATVLELAGSRVTASEVLDLAGSDPVRRRFDLDDDDVEQLRAWTAGTGVRWGLTAGHRGPWQMGGVGQGTWESGLDRLLTGLALQDDLLAGTLPHDDVDSSDVALAGRFAELVERLESAVAALSGRHPVAHWMDALHDAVESLADVPRDGAWQWVALRRELDEVRTAAAGTGALVCLADVTSLLERRLQGRPTSAGFRTGGLTVCTLTPMRSVPHRVVCLLGLDDGAFPRTAVVDGDDLLARDPHLGERDPRSEDRQLLLDAICAAGDALVITYAGSDARTGAPLPPAVPLGELLDVLDATTTTDDAAPARDTVVVRHPLQPFDAACFTPGRLGRAAPLSFDPASWAGARALRGDRRPAPSLVTSPLPADTPAVVELNRLGSFWEHPARGFLRQRLDVQASSWDEDPDDALPVELDGLQDWKVGDRVLAARLDGEQPAVLREREQARGDLPPGLLSAAALERIGGRVEAVLVAASAHLGPLPTSVDLDLDLPDGRRLVGSVHGVRGTTLLSTTYSTLAGKHRFRAWVELLAVSACRPAEGWQAVVVGRSRDDAAVWQAGPLDPDEALRALHDLVLLRDAGLRAPLPLPVKTSELFARRQAVKAREAWNGGYQREGEREQVEHALCWGPDAPPAILTAWRSPLLPDTSHTDLIDRVWGPLLAAEGAR